MNDSSPQARFDRQIAHLRRVFEHERQMLAYDIHDGVLQDLVGAKWALESNLTKIQSGQRLDEGLLASAQDLIGNAITELRQTVLEHRPFALGEQTLAQAIGDFVNRLPQRETSSSYDGFPRPSPQGESTEATGSEARLTEARLTNESQLSRNLSTCPQVEIDLDVDIDCGQLRGDLQLNLYRIVQQAVHNSLHHALPSKICVSLSKTATSVRLSVADNGIGFDPADAPRVGLGLASIRERTQMFDGTCRIESKPGLGTTVEVTIPLSPDSVSSF